MKQKYSKIFECCVRTMSFWCLYGDFCNAKGKCKVEVFIQKEDILNLTSKKALSDAFDQSVILTMYALFDILAYLRF